jgi:hypothetical protein
MGTQQMIHAAVLPAIGQIPRYAAACGSASRTASTT